MMTHDNLTELFRCVYSYVWIDFYHIIPDQPAPKMIPSKHYI